MDNKYVCVGFLETKIPNFIHHNLFDVTGVRYLARLHCLCFSESI